MLKNYNEIIRSLREFYDSPVNTIEIRRLLEKKTWSGKFETFMEYCQDKKVIAQKLKMQESEIVEYIVEGILNPVLKNQARMMNFKTVEEIVQAFRMIGNDSRLETFSRRPVKCYCCNQFGHIAAYCWKKRNVVGPYRCETNTCCQSISRNIAAAVKNDLVTSGDGRNGQIEFQLININNIFRALYDTGSPI